MLLNTPTRIMIWVLLALATSVACAPEAPTFRADSSGGDDVTGTAAGENLAPDFTLPAIDGSEFRLSDTAGQVTLVDFWATWCAPCREEIPMLNELQAEFGKRGFRVVAISDEPADVIEEFVKSYDVQYMNLVGSQELMNAYAVPGLPSAYLVDTEGRIVESFLGPKPERVLVRRIEELLSGRDAT